MSLFTYLLIGIAAVALIVIALFFLAKGLLALACWSVRLIPTAIKATVFWVVIVLLYTTFQITHDLPALPLTAYLVLYLVIFALILVRNYIKYRSIFGASTGSSKGYVLNKKSKVIHEKYSDSEESISPRHRKELSYSEASELINNNEKYHFKKGH